jgi:hypothetical protein
MLSKSFGGVELVRFRIAALDVFIDQGFEFTQSVIASGDEARILNFIDDVISEIRDEVRNLLSLLVGSDRRILGSAFEIS